MRLFLRLNGVSFEASAEDKYTIIKRLAAGEISQNELAEWLRA